MCGFSEIKLDGKKCCLYLGYFGGRLSIGNTKYDPYDLNTDKGFNSEKACRLKLKTDKKTKQQEQKMRTILTSLGTDKLIDLIIEFIKNGEEN
jgi:hypothetical protein